MKHWLLAFLILTVVPLSAAATLNVVATHAVLAEIAAQVGADAINVTTLIPSGFCPAHYDLSPSDYAALINADLVLYSGFEPWVEQLSGDTQPDALIQLAGSWNTPGAAAQLASAIADVLSERLPDASDTFHSNSEDYAQELAAIDQTLSERAAALDVSGTPVICMAWQAEFVSWLGFDVAVTYGLPENLSIRDLIDLVWVVGFEINTCEIAL